MKQGRWRVSALAALTFVAVAPFGLDVASAQNGVTPPASAAGTAPRLPSEIFAADPVTADQIAQIEAYSRLYVPRLLAETDGADETPIVNARFELIQPLSFPGVSEDFRTQYSRIVSQQLAGALDPQRPLLTRLNTMIVVSRLKLDATVLGLILQGLADESPAVRYWAVKALSDRPAGVLSGQQLNEVYARLEQMLQREDALQVLRQVFQVLVDLPGQQGLDLVVASLNQRVGIHAQQPLLPFDAEHSGMEAALRRMIRLQAEGTPVEENMRQLARAAARYLSLIAQTGPAHRERITGQLAESYLRIAGLSHQVLNQAHQQLAAPGATIPPIPNQLNWEQFGVAAEAAHHMLTNPPFDFEPADLTTGANGAEGAAEAPATPSAAE